MLLSVVTTNIEYGNKITIKKLVDILEYLSDLYHNTSDITKIVSDKNKFIDFVNVSLKNINYDHKVKKEEEI